MVRHLVIDGDGHVEEDRERLTALLPEKMRGLAPHYETQPDGSQVQYVEGKPWSTDFAFPFGPQQHVMAGGEVRYGGKDPKVRLEVLDSEGIDVAVLYPSVGLMFGLYQDPEVAAAICHAYNDWLAEYCAADPQRLVGVALLAQQNPESCATELDRCVNELGFVGGMMRPNRIQGITVDDPVYEELWSRAQDLDVPITFHEGYLGGVEIVGLERVRNYATAHVMSHPMEMMTAMVTLATAGVFNRYPRLRFGFFEAGCSWAPFWVERIEEHYELMPGDFKGGDIHGALRERAYFTFEIDEAGVPATAELGFGDRLCFASDYPHFDAVYPGVVKTLRDRHFGTELEQKILGDNALEFFGERFRTLVAPLQSQDR